MYIGYLPPGTEVGNAPWDFPTVGTYPQPRRSRRRWPWLASVALAAAPRGHVDA